MADHTGDKETTTTVPTNSSSVHSQHRGLALFVWCYMTPGNGHDADKMVEIERIRTHGMTYAATGGQHSQEDPTTDGLTRDPGC